MPRQSLLVKVSARLGGFLKPILAGADKVRRRFLQQAVTGVLASGSLVVTEIARQIHDGAAALDYTAKRLCRELVVESWRAGTSDAPATLPRHGRPLDQRGDARRGGPDGLGEAARAAL